jgi:hypothetical protein
MRTDKHQSGVRLVALIGIMLLAAACGDESDKKQKAEEPDVFNIGDYVMNQCTIYYDQLYGWSQCREAEQWSLRPNQPVFTALSDCLVAKGHEQDEDPLIWDDSRQDRDRGYADLVVCSVVQGGL